MGEKLTLIVTEVEPHAVHLGFEGPRSFVIVRGELPPERKLEREEVA